MHPTHKALFDKHEATILAHARERLDTLDTELTKLGGFESMVYSCARDGRELILKCTHTGHRSAEQIHGELEWVRHLIANDVPCAAPAPFADGSDVITIPLENSAVHLYLWEKASGEAPLALSAGPDLWRHWGAVLARMHHATRDFEPSSDNCRRHEWYHEYTTEYMNRFDDEPELLGIQEELIEAFRALPVECDSYGLVHTDLHHGNFFVENGHMTVFDFDDCHYDWFAQDIAMPLFYFLFDVRQDPVTRQQLTQRFWREFISGYREEYDLDQRWLTRLPLFLKQRELVLYFLIQDIADWRSSRWCAGFMDGRREYLVTGNSVVEFDLTNI